MSSPTTLTKLRVDEFAERFGSAMIPVSNSFSYFSALPLSEEETRDLIQEPVAALPPALQNQLPRVSLVLVPYLEKNGTRGAHVAFERPAASRLVQSAQVTARDHAVLLFAVKEQESADYHYTFYHAVADLSIRHAQPELQKRFDALLREELASQVHGEVDEQSWRLKQVLLRKQANVRRETKIFRTYAQHSIVDTFTLYLHGICCDIDVETGPRQLPSRHLKRRLLLLQEFYPPPPGYCVFPEELNGSR
jgi:hypothetical protein